MEIRARQPGQVLPLLSLYRPSPFTCWRSMEAGPAYQINLSTKSDRAGRGLRNPRSGTAFKRGRSDAYICNGGHGTGHAKEKSMTPDDITRVEFLGGPEDGRVFDAEAFRGITEAASDESDEIPLIVREDRGGADEEAEFHLLGLYVAKGQRGSTLQYQWAGLP